MDLNLEELINLKQKLASFKQQKMNIRQKYEDIGLQIIQKPEKIVSDIEEIKYHDTQNEDYKVMKQELSQHGFSQFRILRQGDFTFLIFAKHSQTNIRYAIKGIIFKDETGKIDKIVVDYVNQERNNLNICQGSPYVVNFLGQIEGKQFMYLILNECQGTLSDILIQNSSKKLNEMSAIKYAHDIAEGLKFIHSKNIIFNDLNIENIMIDYQGNAVLSDFVQSDQVVGGYAQNQYQGNIYYQPPECTNKEYFEEYFQEYTKLGIVVEQKPNFKSEASSLGYLIHWLIEGFSMNLIFSKHKPITYSQDFENLRYKKELKQIIDGLTQFVPDRRIKIDDALTILKQIISEIKLNSQAFELFDIKYLRQINGMNFHIEFIEASNYKFYPIFKNEDEFNKLMNKIQSMESNSIKLQLQLQSKDFSEKIKPDEFVKKCIKFKLNEKTAQKQLDYLQQENIICIDLIGKGSFGLVISAKFNKTYIAIKIIEIQDKEKTEKLKKEHEFLQIFQDSKYILNIKKTIDANLDSPTIFIITDLCQGELTDLINKKITKKEIVSIMIQLLIGLEELKQMKIIHNDIKPPNILYNFQNGNYQVKISDFGSAKQLSNKDLTDNLSTAGTKKYTSQEIIFEEKISYKTDVYSLGIVFIELIFGRIFQYEGEIQSVRQGNLGILDQRPNIPNRNFNEIDDFMIEQLIKNMVQTQDKRKSSDELLSIIFNKFKINLKEKSIHQYEQSFNEFRNLKF